MIGAAEGFAIEAIMSSTGVFSGILVLEVLQTQEAIVGDQDDVITFTVGRECPEEVVDVVVDQRTWVAIGVTGQDDKRARGKGSSVWGHLNGWGTYFVCMTYVIVH